MTAPDLTTYEDRPSAIFDIVQKAGVNGITSAGVCGRVPWRTTSAEITGKLVSLRKRDCIFRSSDGYWYA
jgi:hypothetical protein